jgi:ribosomal protein L32
MERHLMNFMTRGANKDAATARHCWSCKGEVARPDHFCRHCGMWSPLHRDESIHGRLVSIEKLLLKTIFGVGAVWLLVGWIVLQMFHFDIYHR